MSLLTSGSGCTLNVSVGVSLIFLFSLRPGVSVFVSLNHFLLVVPAEENTVAILKEVTGGAMGFASPRPWLNQVADHP